MGLSTHTDITDLQTRAAPIVESFLCLNVLRKRTPPTKAGSCMHIRYTGVVCKRTERVTRWDDKEVSTLVGDDFGLCSGMGNSNVYFGGPLGCQWASSLLYLRSYFPIG